MVTKYSKWIVMLILLSFQTILSQSKGIRYQYAYLNNLVAPNLAGNNSSTFEIGNGDVMVYTPYFNLSNQPNTGYCALSRFGPDLCYKGSKLIPYPPYVSNLFSNVISKNDGGFAMNTNTKPYIIRNYDSDANLIFETEIYDENNYSTTNAPQSPKMFAHPITHNLLFAYLEYSDDINNNFTNYKGKPLLNILEISNTTGEVLRTFKLEIQQYKTWGFLGSTFLVDAWSFNSEIIDMKYTVGNTPSKDRIWFTLNLKNEGYYFVNQNGQIVNNPSGTNGLYSAQNYTGVFSIAPEDAINIDNKSMIGLLPSSPLPKIIESGFSNLNNGLSSMMLFTVENQKPIIYKFPWVWLVDILPSTRYEFPTTVINNYGDIKRYQNSIFFSFDNYFGTFNESNLQINLRKRNSGFPFISNSGNINYQKANNNSLYLNYNTTTGSGNPTNFLIKESLADFPITCFSTNFSNSVATSQAVSQNYNSLITGTFKSLDNVRTKEDPGYSYTEISNNSIMSVYLQCNVGPCSPPVSSKMASNDNNENSIVTLSPNPTNSHFELSGDVSIERVELYSLLGQLVKTFEKQEQYSVTDIAKGTYIVKITTVEGPVNKTLVIE